jgi:predicted metal-dependent peptidase
VAAPTLTVAQKMSAARMMIRDKLPYFRAALFGAVYKETEKLGTYAMTERGVLLYDPKVVEAESVENCAASIMHELMHWLRDHAKRCRAIAAHPRLWNYAADAEINDDITAMGLKLPPTCIWAANLGQKDGNIAEVYYQHVRQNAKVVKQPGAGGGGKGDPQDGDGSGDGDGGDSPSAGAGWCGSCAGRPHPQEPKTGSGGGEKGDKDAAGGGKGDADKGDGGDADGKSDAEAGRIRKQVAEAAVAHASSKSRGTVPAGFLAWAQAEIAPPKIDWRTKLAKVLRAAMAYRPGVVTTTWSGFGRKQAALGFGAGRPLTPKWRSPVPRVAVAVDTSGSMGSGEGSPLHAAASEVDGILRATNAAIQFVACDARVHSAKAVRTWQEAVREFKGGGGTDFCPVFEHFENLRSELPPEVIIFITDGYGPAPAQAPRGVHTIWVLIGGNETAPATWGDVIVVDKDGAKDGQRTAARR